MNNKFDDNLKKALTEYEKEIVEDAEKNSKSKDFFIIRKKWIKFTVAAAAIFVVLLPSIFIGKNLVNENSLQEKKVTEYSVQDSPENNDMLDNTEYEKEIAPKGNPDIGVPEQKFIETFSITSETLNFDKSIDDLNKILEKFKGYIEIQDINNVKNYNNLGRTAYYSYKIPNKDLDSFIKEFDTLNINIINKNKSLTNVTNHYKDLNKDLELVNAKLESLQGLLSKATNLSDIIELESKIHEVQAEKTEIENNLSSLDEEVNYSTVNITIEEVDKYTGTENISSGFGSRIKQAFKNSYGHFIVFLQNTLLGFITILPFIIVATIIILVIVKIRKHKK